MTRVFAVFWLTGFAGHKRRIKVLHQLKLLTKVLTLMFYYEGVNKIQLSHHDFTKKAPIPSVKILHFLQKKLGGLRWCICQLAKKLFFEFEKV